MPKDIRQVFAELGVFSLLGRIKWYEAGVLLAVLLASLILLICMSYTEINWAMPSIHPLYRQLR
ncbi:MAG: hypothetical protein MN733_25900 [Nitrososphaera sp.]|nr:hypothetical protein [Nitrososphaera sp.]